MSSNLSIIGAAAARISTFNALGFSADFFKQSPINTGIRQMGQSWIALEYINRAITAANLAPISLTSRFTLTLAPLCLTSRVVLAFAPLLIQNLRSLRDATDEQNIKKINSAAEGVSERLSTLATTATLISSFVLIAKPDQRIFGVASLAFLAFGCLEADKKNTKIRKIAPAIRIVASIACGDRLSQALAAVSIGKIAYNAWNLTRGNEPLTFRKAVTTAFNNQASRI